MKRALIFFALLAAACGDDTSGTTPDDGLPTSDADVGMTHDDTGGDGLDGGGTGQDTGGVADMGADDVGSTPDMSVPTCTVGEPEGALQIATDRGLVEGESDDGVARFLGMPFAAPPTGDNRFRPPQPSECWDDVRDATEYAPGCLQRDLFGILSGEEDCLYLNVWTPEDALEAAEPRPVMYWIYGGANVVGATNQALVGGNLYDGKTLAEEFDVVVVSVGYRVGFPGFLGHQSLADEDPNGSSGNYGTLDQIAGLEWVQRNIASFGGDPDKVTLFGESAGGINICSLVASPLTDGLFAGAIMQSGFCVGLTQEERQAFDAVAVEEMGCADAADVAQCLRDLPAEEVALGFSTDTPEGMTPIEAEVSLPAANIDGWVLEAHPLDVFEAGTHRAVPMIIGSNRDENTIFMTDKIVPTCINYELEVEAMYPDDYEELLELYPCDFLNPKQALIELNTDSYFSCHVRRAAQALGDDAPVYRYWYEFVGGPLFALGAYHTAEIPYVFGTYPAQTTIPLPSEHTMSDILGAYWTTFAATGDPNDGTQTTWEQYDLAADNAHVLDTEPERRDAIRAERCDFWDRVTPR